MVGNITELILSLIQCYSIQIETGDNQVECVQMPIDGVPNSEAPMVVTYTGSTDVFVEGALDVPGATIEIVETDLQPELSSVGRKQPKKGAPAYRQQLLTKLVTFEYLCLALAQAIVCL